MKIILIYLTFLTSLASVHYNSSADIKKVTSFGEYHLISDNQLYFKDLRKYRMGAREVPDEIKKFNGKQIQIVGFMIPFDSIEKVDRFILLQAPFMGCFHVPPPQPNETLLINSGNVRIDYTYEPVRITGKLIIEDIYIEQYLVAMYSIQADKIEIVSQNDAELEGLPANFHMFGEF